MSAQTSADDTAVATRIDELESMVRGLEVRMRALEGVVASARRAAEGGPESVGGSHVVLTAQAGLPGDTPTRQPPQRLDVATLLSLVGRTFVVFGGAYLLRALTDSGRLPGVWGIALGLCYAGMWLSAADRAAARGAHISALFHGFSTVVIGLPLLWEAFARFHLLSAGASALLLAALIAVALFVAWRRELQSLAGLCMVGAIVTAFALMSAAGQVAPFAALLILLGVATLWLSYDRDWYWIRWPAALAADLVVIGFVARAIKHPPLEAPSLAIAAALGLLAGYLASIAARTLVRGRLVIPFEVTQALATVAIGLGGAVVVARANEVGEPALGLAGLVLGFGSYLVAFAFVERRQGLGANFYFYTSLGLVLTLVGAGILFSAPGLVVVAAGLGVFSAWLARAPSRVALVVHAAVCVVVAGFATGMLTRDATALAGTIDFVPAPWSTWVALVAPLACLAIARPVQTGVAGSIASFARFVLGLVLVVSLGGEVVRAAASLFAGAPPDPGIVATVRTAVIAVAAIVLAIAHKYDRFRELGWLLYPVLAIGGMKLLFEDFQRSRPSTLFIALALFGAALVAAPRLVRRTENS